VNRRLRLLVAVARRLPHPDPPTSRYLSVLRSEPRPTRLVRRVTGGVSGAVRIDDRVIDLDHGPARIRSYRPRSAGPTERLPMVVNFHGGGFVFGNLSQTDWLCARVAEQAGVVVVSVSYRLAPEHPAPVPYQDCWSATQWLLRHVDDLGVDAAAVSVMGSSAGGNLAALVAISHRDRCRDDPSLAPLRHQILIYPATDLSLSSPSVAELGRAPILTRPIMDWYGRQYLPQGLPDSFAFDDPRISPLFHTDLTDCAPALIIGAGRDPLRDDATRYGAALDRAAVPNRVIMYPEAIHGFISMPRLAPEAECAVTEIVGTLGSSRPR
jgi:acetyl esterase